MFCCARCVASGLKGTELERAQCGTLRLKLLKIGAQLRISVRKVWVSFSESYPGAELFRQVLRNLQASLRGCSLIARSA